MVNAAEYATVVNCSTLDVALDYRNRGWSIIPTVRSNKKPALGGWKEFQNRQATEEEVRQWFADGDWNVSIITGAVSGGLAVRDFDAEGAYDRWAAQYPETAKTLPTVVTGRPGGRHLYFHVADDVREAICRDLGKDGHGKVKCGDGELSLGSGSYVVAPTSIHANGNEYHWEIPLGDDLPTIDPCEVGLMQDWSTTSSPVTLQSVRSHRVTDVVGTSVLSGHSVLSVEEAVEAAIRATVPIGPSQRNDQTFRLARQLKAIPELANAQVEDLKPFVRRWYDQAVDVIGTKNWDANWFAFREAWRNVKFPVGDDVLQRALSAVLTDPPPKCVEQYKDPRIRMLVALCASLQRQHGGGVFFIACRSAGALLGVRHTEAALWLRGLVEDGILKIEERSPQGKRRATRYRFIGDAPTGIVSA